jgi:hypothetical protein
MKNISVKEFYTSEAINKIAIRNYRTYVAHYKSRKLIPMPLNEFLENYNS